MYSKLNRIKSKWKIAPFRARATKFAVC